MSRSPTNGSSPSARNRKRGQHPPPRPALTIISLNVEGLSATKEELVAQLCREHQCDILCLQETHRGSKHPRPRVEGMTTLIERPHEKHGSVMLAKNGTIIESTSKSDENNIEVLTAELRGITITSVYKPPPTPFLMPEIPSSGKPRIVIGDFNSHSSQWGYAGNNADGDAVEAWAETNQLYLIHDAKQPKSFNSG